MFTTLENMETLVAAVARVTPYIVNELWLLYSLIYHVISHYIELYQFKN